MAKPHFESCTMKDCGKPVAARDFFCTDHWATLDAAAAVRAERRRADPMSSLLAVAVIEANVREDTTALSTLWPSSYGELQDLAQTLVGLATNLAVAHADAIDVPVEHLLDGYRRLVLRAAGDAA